MTIIIQLLISIIMMIKMIESAPYAGGHRSNHAKSIRLTQSNGGIITNQPLLMAGGADRYSSLFRSLNSNSGTHGGGTIPISIQTKHNIEYKDIPSSGTIQTATVEVGARSIPINIIFRSASSSLNVLQRHQSAVGDTQESSSEDEPHRLLHTVKKPIIQEIREVISPFRKILQEVHPVQEEIKTVVAKNSGNNHHYQPIGQNRPTLITSGPYAAAASTTKNHHIKSPSTLILDTPDSSNEDFDDLVDNNSSNHNHQEIQKLIQSGNAIVTSSSLLKGNDIDGKSIAKSMDQSLSKSVAALLKTPTSQIAKTKPSTSQSTSISISSSSSASSLSSPTSSSL